ncbi:hypothetical protein AAMO2058_000757700 [Amorphochlora amoebiformis]
MQDNTNKVQRFLIKILWAHDERPKLHASIPQLHGFGNRIVTAPLWALQIYGYYKLTWFKVETQGRYCGL